MNAIYVIVSVIIVSLISVIAVIPLMLKKKTSKHSLLFLLSISVGVLLATVFLNLLPESVHDGYRMEVGFIILAGFFTMFIIEKFVHHRHEDCKDCGHSHAYNLAPINLIGDGIHNFIDGLVIAGAYAVNITLGLTATLSIIFHEIPQEISDFGILLYSGYSKKKALIFNLLSATTAILGAILGLFLVQMHDFEQFIIPFAAGNFIYIAASNLLPELHRHCKIKESIFHFIAILIGIGIIVLVTLYAPHTH